MNTKRSLLIVSLLAIVLSFSSCYYDKSEEVYPPNAAPCDTTAVSYKTDIVGILSPNCYSCHSTVAAPISGNSNILDQHSEVVKLANSGQLLNAIEHTNVPATKFMPQGGQKLSNCNIDIIKAWINAGAPNN